MENRQRNVASIQTEIPVFFAVDDVYLPFLSVAIRSLTDHAKPENFYAVYILNQGLNEETKSKLMEFETENLAIRFCDMTEMIAPIEKDLNLRDYYTPSIYYRLFIPILFPIYDKAIYLDSDVVLMNDIAALYAVELQDNLVGAVVDEVVDDSPVYRAYAEGALQLAPHTYFNSGVLVMNLKEFRRLDVTGHFIYLLKKYGLDAICPDQDYLNVLCKGRVCPLEAGWDKMSTDEDLNGPLHLIHFNMFWKPWHYEHVPYEKHFWQVAEKTEYADALRAMQSSFTEAEKQADQNAGVALEEQARQITAASPSFGSVMATDPKMAGWECR